MCPVKEYLLLLQLIITSFTIFGLSKYSITQGKHASFVIEILMNRKSNIMKNVLSMVFYVGLFFWASQALAECVKPDYSPPACTNQYIELQFSDSNDFKKCKRDVTIFLKTLELWKKCIADETRLNGDIAIQLFNCKVSGTANCLNTSK